MPGESYSIKHKRKPNSFNEQHSMTELTKTINHVVSSYFTRTSHKGWNYVIKIDHKRAEFRTSDFTDCKVLLYVN